MPSFVQQATNTWTIEALSAHRARLTMTVEMTTRGLLGVIMKPMVGVGMSRVLRTNLEDLKHFIENDSPSQRKTKKKPK